MGRAFWNGLFEFFDSVLGDNVYVFIFLFSTIVGVILVLINRLFKRKLIFGPISMLFVLFVGKMTTHLPMYHPRVHRALSISSGIIASSKEYLKSFCTETGLVNPSKKEIASYLYYAKEKLECEPHEIYDSVHRTLNSIKEGLFLPEVDKPVLGTWLFICTIVVILILLVIAFKKKKYWFICVATFLLLMSFISSGAMIASYVLLVVESVLFLYLHIISESNSY